MQIVNQEAYDKAQNQFQKALECEAREPGSKMIDRWLALACKSENEAFGVKVAA